MEFGSLTLAVASIFLATFGLFIWIGGGILRARKSALQQLMVSSSDALREERLKKPVSERAIAPVVMRLGRLLSGLTPVGWIKKVERRLTLAGRPGSLDAPAWAAVKVLSTAVAIVLAYFLQSGLPTQQRFLAVALLVVLGFFGPDAYLQRKIDDRRKEMRRTLPDVLDLLVISVEAGLGFDSALARVVATVPGALSAEFFRMLQETRVGMSRRDALRHMMDRTDVEELRSFLLAMLQAEAFGVAIARVLRVQADEMRIKRRQLAQERAFAAPVKMVFPLVFCIFPSLFIVLLGPAMITITESLGDI